MLGIASICDVWKREINDLLWIGFGVAAVLLIFAGGDVISTLQHVGISLIIAPLAIVIWRIGIFGGADAFALIVLGALAPHATLSNNTVTPFTTLTNAAIISILPIFANLGRNLIAVSMHRNIFDGFEETKLKKILAMFLGYRSQNPKYGFAIEKREKDHKRLDFSFHHAENSEFCNTIDTWITPGIPYIIYITAGFIVQLFFGDIIFDVLGNFLINS